MSHPPAVLVTGGSGFIGSWVVKKLKERGLTPVVLDIAPNPERWTRLLGKSTQWPIFESGSFVDRQFLQHICDKHSVDRIIHLGALLTPACQSDPYHGAEVNIMGSLAIFETARALGNRFQGIVYASSYAVYGAEPDDPSELISNESCQPPSFYGAYKLAVDSIALQYWKHFQIKSFALRPHVVYGPERTIGLTAGPSLAAKAIANGEGFELNYTGLAGYDYVEDVANLFVEASIATPSGANVVDLPSEVTSTDEIAAIFAELFPESKGKISVKGNGIPPNVPPVERPVSQFFPKFKATSLRDGLRKTVEYYRGQ